MILTLSPVFDVTDVNFKQNKKKNVSIRHISSL